MRRTRSASDCRKSRAVCSSAISLSMSAIEGCSGHQGVIARMVDEFRGHREPVTAHERADAAFDRSCVLVGDWRVLLGNFGNAHSFPHFAVAQTRLLWTVAVNAVLILRLRMRRAVEYRLRAGQVRRGRQQRLPDRAARPVKPQNFGERSHLSHTPVTILTGFLGSGKTTLLNRALRDPAMANTAVVINEFGEIGRSIRRSLRKATTPSWCWKRLPLLHRVRRSRHPR